MEMGKKSENGDTVEEEPKKPNEGAADIDSTIWNRIVRAFTEKMCFRFEQKIPASSPTETNIKETDASEKSLPGVQPILSGSEYTQPSLLLAYKSSSNVAKEETSALYDKLRLTTFEIEDLIVRAKKLVYQESTGGIQIYIDDRLKYHIQKLQRIQKEIQQIYENVDYLKLQITAVKLSIKYHKRDIREKALESLTENPKTNVLIV